MHKLGTVATFALGLGACLPGLPTNPNVPPGSSGGGGSNAEAEFVSNVAPMFDANACVGCHIGPETDATYHYLGQSDGDYDGYYTGILTQPQIYGGGDGNFSSSTALLVTKGPHDGATWWSPSQLSTIEQWLNDEAKARTQVNPPNPGAPPSTPGGATADGAMAQWASCLTVGAAGGQYFTTQVYLLSQMQSDSGVCSSCHDPGEPGGMALLADPHQELTAWESQSGVLTAVEVEDTGSGYMMMPAAQRLLDKSMEKANGDGTHPAFTWPQTVDGIDMGQALTTFVQDVNQILLAGQCPAPGYAGP